MREDICRHFQSIASGEHKGTSEAPSFGIWIKLPSHPARPQHADNLSQCVLEDPIEGCTETKAIATFDSKTEEKGLGSKDMNVGIDETLKYSPSHETIVGGSDALGQKGRAQQS